MYIYFEVSLFPSADRVFKISGAKDIRGWIKGVGLALVVAVAPSQYFYGFQFKLSGCLTIKLSQAVFYAKEADKMGRMLSCY